MAKGYWITAYRRVTDETALARYAERAGPVIAALGGRFLARGPVLRAYESGLELRLVIIEFASVERAVAAYESPEYQALLALLDGAVERDVRIIPGV